MCLCNSAVHATNHAAPQDLTVQDEAMFSCCHVFSAFGLLCFLDCFLFSCFHAFWCFSRNIFQLQGATGSFKWPSPTKLHLIRPGKRILQGWV